ncbi:MAG: L-2-hydroxyglutarate oxidase [Betaproteobacteria bacterium]
MFDYVVIGGGIVGVATAWTVAARNPGASIVLLEKERALATHQTGRNSGVIHAGVYYEPGSLKAKLCKEGRAETVAFCERHGVPYHITGKLLVATDAIEVTRARALSDRCRTNGIDHEWLDGAELERREPFVAGLAAILVPSTGIADYAAMTRKMAELLRVAGGEIRLGEEVVGLREEAGCVVVETADTNYRTRRLIVCGGLQSDRLAHRLGLGREVRIVPFRGEYFRLRKVWSDRFRHLIYPIPDPSLPFLGVHLTKMVDGSVTVGPNAVLGFSREGYAKFAVDRRDLTDTLSFPGFWKAMVPHLRSGVAELLNSASRRRYVRLCQRYCPTLAVEDLETHPAGIRAQAVWMNGRMEHDFLLLNSRRTVHVCNAPSPAATSALPIARHIVDEADKRLVD